jgi:hypothetical protein
MSTRRTYEILTAAINAARAEIRDNEPPDLQRDLLDGVSYAAEFIAFELARESVKFDRHRFLRDTGTRDL